MRRSGAEGKRQPRTSFRHRAWGSVLVVLTLALTGCTADSPPSAPPKVTRPASTTDPVVAPYLYRGGARPPDPAEVMARTGIRWFSMAFVLSGGGCEPAWPEQAGLGGRAADLIRRVHRSGGHVVISMGGAEGRKLGVSCPDAGSLAAAYQTVIDRYQPEAVDFDVEGTEFDNAEVQDRILRALTTLGRRNPRITLSMTLPATPDGLDRRGRRLVRRATEVGAPVDVWMIMPFNFGRGDADMGRLAIRATERTHDQLRSFYAGRSDRAIYGLQGVVLMNGKTDTGEVATQDDFRQVRAYAERRHLARLSFWSLNRDRPCRAHESRHTCSGVQQRPWAFTDILQAGRHGQ